jgi:molecular chaperone HtpG
MAVFSANDKVRKQLHIPDDISFSILSKLSIKSLKRFGCLSKSWSLLFDDPFFMTLYRNHFLTKEHSYYQDTSVLLHQIFYPWDGDYWDKTFELSSLSGERFKNRVKLDWPSVKFEPAYLIDPRVKTEYDSGFDLLGYGSVHGILCLSCVLKVNIILWNPTIKEFKLIPPRRNSSYVYLKSFGYDCVKDDYKVTCLGKMQCEIYSLRSDSWRILDDINTTNSQFTAITSEQLYMDGLSHWLSRSGTCNETSLISFDWSNEVFITTPIPSDMNDDICNCFWVSTNLVLLNGSIALILIYTKTSTFHISILGELGVKESWTKLCSVGPLLSYRSRKEG